jgi:hypothetical protein
MSLQEFSAPASFNGTSVAMECHNLATYGTHPWGLAEWVTIISICSFIVLGSFILGFMAANALMNLDFLRACAMRGAKSNEEIVRVAHKWMALGRYYEGLKLDVESQGS